MKQQTLSICLFSIVCEEGRKMHVMYLLHVYLDNRVCPRAFRVEVVKPLSKIEMPMSGLAAPKYSIFLPILLFIVQSEFERT